MELEKVVAVVHDHPLTSIDREASLSSTIEQATVAKGRLRDFFMNIGVIFCMLLRTYLV